MVVERLREPAETTTTWYEQNFTFPGTMSGFSFRCNEHGQVDTTIFSPEAHSNYQNVLLLAKEGKIIQYPVEKREHVYYDRGSVRCLCGEIVELVESWANGCPGCDREYDGSGSLLNPRWMWGEETGETFGTYPYGDD